MNIKEFSHIIKISAYTIRYYEKIGLIQHISRNSSGHRTFTKKDITWLEFVKRLKDTGMSLDDIKKYADLREEGVHTSMQGGRSTYIYASNALTRRACKETRTKNKS